MTDSRGRLLMMCMIGTISGVKVVKDATMGALELFMTDFAELLVH